MTAREIADIFSKIELRLIASLKRNLKRHKEWEASEGFRWPAWQAEKLQNLERFRQENKAIMEEYRSVIDEETEAIIREEYNVEEENQSGRRKSQKRGSFLESTNAGWIVLSRT